MYLHIWDVMLRVEEQPFVVFSLKYEGTRSTRKKKIQRDIQQEVLFVEFAVNNSQAWNPKTDNNQHYCNMKKNGNHSKQKHYCKHKHRQSPKADEKEDLHVRISTWHRCWSRPSWTRSTAYSRSKPQLYGTMRMFCGLPLIGHMVTRPECGGKAHATWVFQTSSP